MTSISLLFVIVYFEYIFEINIRIFSLLDCYYKTSKYTSNYLIYFYNYIVELVDYSFSNGYYFSIVSLQICGYSHLYS